MTTDASAGSSRVVVTPAADGLRLDVCIAALTSLSRRAARGLISEGSVWRNGEALRVQSRPVAAGDVLDILRPPGEVGPVDPALTPVPILHDDGWLIVADKPSGVLSQPAEGGAPDDLALDQLLLMQLAARDGRRPFLRLVHRLDRLTSGTLLFAARPQALAPLRREWDAGTVERIYVAVVEGSPDRSRFEVDQPIGRDPTRAWRFRVDPDGRPARTEVEIVAGSETGITVALCRLHTGRTHQVRVHLAEAGLPVVGDRLYGGRGRGGVGRPLLHAAVLRLPHPRDGAILTVSSPLPPAFGPFVPDGLDPSIMTR